MKRIYSVLCMTAGVIAAVSCAKESVNDAPAKDSQTVLCANIEQTKTALEDLSIVWSENDALTVLDNKGAKATFTLQSGAGQQSGQFVGSLPQSEGATCFYAVYPQNDNVALSGAAISVNVPTTQTYVENNIGIGANMSIAQFTLDSKDNLSFMNTGGLLKLQLYASDVTVKQIIVVDNEGKALSGKATATLNYDGTPSLSFTSGVGQVNLDCGEGVHLATTSAEATKFFISVPAGVFAKGFTVKILDSSDKIYTLKTTKDNTIQRSTILVMGAVELTTPTTVVDLNANGETSNCYLISAAGEYKMKATVMGNGKTVGSIAPSALAPSVASFLWATKGTGTAPAAGEIIGGVFYLNDCIYFTATGVKGNAVVAANDADGNIIWSWHIWCDSDLKIYGESPANVKGFPMGTDQTVYCIDRELGAFSNAKDDVLCAGLRYQWGRKDPFPGPKNYKSSGAAESDEQQVQGVKRDRVSTKVTLAEATSHPTTMYGIKSGSDGWQSTTDNTLWGGTWDSGKHTGTTTKTIYDPCPKGYQVVPNGTFYKCKKSGSWSYGDYLVTSNSPNTNMGWFPAAGFRRRSTGLLYDVSTYIYCWSSYSASGAASFLDAISNGFYPEGTAAANQAIACPVRCCQVSE